MSVLLVEKVNPKFQEKTQSKQASGLSVCLDLISRMFQKDVMRIPVSSLDHLELAIQRFRPKKVLIQALWVSDIQWKTLREKYPNTKFYAHIHSNIPFLCTEGSAFHLMKVAKDNGVTLAFNDIRAKAIFRDSVYLPNIYNMPMLTPNKDRDKSVLNVICAGSLRPMKNHATQAIAAILYAQELGTKLRFHINGTRTEGGEEVKSSLISIFETMSGKGHELVMMPWLEHGEFRKYLTNMDIGMQVSMSESFNIVAADYASCHLPMVVSDEISWAAHEIHAQTGNPQNMISCMRRADQYVHSNICGLGYHNTRAIEIWRDFIC